MNGTALLLLNLGSPDSVNENDVRKYLREFLMDERVIDAPYVIRKIIVEGFILPSRPKRSAEAYEKVWTKAGSPLIAISNRFQHALEEEVDLPMTFAMRYANPTPANALKALEAKCPNMKRILIAPLYPHYAMSSYETALLHVQRTIQKLRSDLDVKVLKPFYEEPAYIQNLAESIKPHLPDIDHLLFSYHGLPVRHLKKSDPTGEHCYRCANCCDTPSVAWNTCYKHQVTRTSTLTAKALNLSRNQYSVSFQSRLGRDEWIKPFTVERLENLPKEGVKRLGIVCPAFVADCLETLEEIAMAGKEIFLEAGGESLTVIPCLNDSAPWVKTFAQYVNKHENGYAALWN
ncbi:MAG: ferrochelatase [Cyclobacteriaceae bacterium]|nr:ferrochelatase [Cyclobacteriaceae bacterium]